MMKRFWFISSVITLLYGFQGLAVTDKDDGKRDDGKGDGKVNVEMTLNESLLERHPHLKKQLFAEPTSNYWLGVSLSPIGVVKDRFLFSAHFFQLHYLGAWIDFELIDVAWAQTTTRPDYVQSNHFVFRTSPKLRLGSVLSVGPLLGYEFVSFPAIAARLNKDNLETQRSEPFSTRGTIYGVSVTQTFSLDGNYKLRVVENIYQQSYSTEKGAYDWSYRFDILALNSDRTPISSGTVFNLEVGLLF